MKLLDYYKTTPEQVFEEFPMLEGLTTFEMTMMRSDMVDIKEDAPFVRAIDILFKRMEEGKYRAPTDDDDDPTGS